MYLLRSHHTSNPGTLFASLLTPPSPSLIPWEYWRGLPLGVTSSCWEGSEPAPLTRACVNGQEVWKASPKLQEKFGKISCNYPNDSCTNHATTPRIPCRQAEPKTGSAKSHIWIQGDLWKLSLWRAWAGEGLQRLQGLRFCCEGGPPQGCPLAGAHSDQTHPTRKSDLLPPLCPLSARLPASLSSPAAPSPGDSLNKSSRDRVTAVSCYCPGLENLLYSVDPNIFLDFDQDPDRACLPFSHRAS